MHREIFKWHSSEVDISELEIDHRNRIKLDNRFENLRLATQQQNRVNRGPSILNKSGYKGVDYDPKAQAWRAQITVNGKKTGLGGYATPEEAAQVYNDAAFQAFGEFAYLNYLPERVIPVRFIRDSNAPRRSFKGRCLCKRSGKWRAYGKADGKIVFLGRFDTEAEAIEKHIAFQNSLLQKQN
ncbi:HNH endonuclease [Phormidium sp. FACHB-592]|uniref:AP2 domain-containing protein n=1 Tax=Stenomitos frigidus AS-A4 TaxID=2933935 RepID=A0ABV0KEL7_9CYAN|nr:AP2 domain-containing protein [Phormidium sp. FACHB-592]MBD2076289.1 HNH endonuclease [Phormidium sp. FACHB-592]